MIWRLWVFVAGCPVGAVAFLACVLHPGPAPGALLALALSHPAAGAAASSALVGTFAVLVASRLARLPADEPERPLHLAAGATFGLASLPAAAAAWLDLAPGPAAHAALAAVALAAGLLHGARAQGSAGGWLRRAGLAAAAVAGASAALLALSVLLALAEGSGAALPPGLAASVLEVDARTPLGPARRCAPSGPAEVLLSRGARPAFGPAGRVLWLDAPVDSGVRQIHRLDLETGALSCWTCGEPGDNLRPRPTADGRAVLFVTTRRAGPLAVRRRDLHSVRATGARPPGGSRRLTFDDAAHDLPVAPPVAATVVFTRRARGRSDVVAAPLRTGHGGVLLGAAVPLLGGGPAFAAAGGWSPDARTLVWLRGNPLAPLEAVAVDPATGAERSLGAGVAWNAGASFAADGGLVALATASRASPLGLAPGWLGAALAPLALRRDEAGVLFRGSGLRLVGADGVPADFDLGEAGRFGAPTGISLAPDLGSVVLGQRREVDGRPEERILRIPLRCQELSPGPDAGRSAPGARG